MLFLEKIDTIQATLSHEFDRLFELAKQQQSHSGNLLLFHINGFYDENQNKFSRITGKKFNPHVIGPGMGGLSWQTHDAFIRKYRDNNIANISHFDYLKLHEWTQERNKEIIELREVEGTSIQLEMLIYLKIWEAEFLIKRLYQLTRIVSRQHYDWYFRISGSSRDNQSTGTAQEIIRKDIRNKIQKHSTILYQLIKDCYKTQIRNSIAHSNYSMLNRGIGLGNFIQNDPHSQLHGLSFDEWTDIFHKTLMLHNNLMRFSRLVNEYYVEIASRNNNSIGIQITEKDGSQYVRCVEYRAPWDSWSPIP